MHPICTHATVVKPLTTLPEMWRSANLVLHRAHEAHGCLYRRSVLSVGAYAMRAVPLRSFGGADTQDDTPSTLPPRQPSTPADLTASVQSEPTPQPETKTAAEQADESPVCCGNSCHDCVLIEYYEKQGLNEAFYAMELQLEQKRAKRERDREEAEAEAAAYELRKQGEAAAASGGGGGKDE